LTPRDELLQASVDDGDGLPWARVSLSCWDEVNGSEWLRAGLGEGTPDDRPKAGYWGRDFWESEDEEHVDVQLGRLQEFLTGHEGFLRDVASGVGASAER
jgi:hypothetical protein